MGKKSRTKGATFERECVNLFKEHYLKARRTALSGALEHEKGDVLVWPGFAPDKPMTGECKRRAKLPAIFRELGEHDFLVVREDRGEALVVLRLEDFSELLQ